MMEGWPANSLLSSPPLVELRAWQFGPIQFVIWLMSISKAASYAANHQREHGIDFGSLKIALATRGTEIGESNWSMVEAACIHTVHLPRIVKTRLQVYCTSRAVATC